MTCLTRLERQACPSKKIKWNRSNRESRPKPPHHEMDVLWIVLDPTRFSLGQVPLETADDINIRFACRDHARRAVLSTPQCEHFDSLWRQTHVLEMGLLAPLHDVWG